ncbi:MAG: leucine-rich repeat domain-containing protein [Muribaculaceae bacterium]|nr:leucine-rich repeat domain-containing protein [Muribaculaceae bacterium]
MLLFTIGSALQSAAFEVNGVQYCVLSEEDKTACVIQSDGGGYIHEWILDEIDCVPWWNEESKYSGDVMIPEKVSLEGVEYTVTKISVAAFANATGLTSITMPNTVTEVMEGAFYGCSNLKEIKFSNQTRGLLGATLEGCNSLTKLDLSGIQDYIELGVYPNLKELILPYDAVYYSIGFVDNPDISVYITNPNPPRGIGVRFGSVPETAILYVPDEAVSNYSLCYSHWPFRTVRPISQAGVDAPVAANPQAFKLNGNTLVATGQDSVEVYDVQGRLMQVVAPGGSIRLASGAYVLRSDNSSEKVIVQ